MTEKKKTVHTLKTHSESFRAVREGRKKYEIRSTVDREFKVGDLLILSEYDPDLPQRFTGDLIVADITYITHGEWGLPSDICVMSIRVMHPE